MSPDEVVMVQSSFAKVAPHANAVGKLFYDRLFEIAPQTRALFHIDMAEQGRKLMETLKVVVDGLSDPPAVVPAAQALARRHVEYGVRADHYPLVGAALLYALETSMGDQFTPEIRQAWTDAYGLLSSVMIDAAYGKAG